MTLIPYDPSRFLLANLAFEAGEGRVLFFLPGEADAVSVRLGDDGLEFIPERSAPHRKILIALGEDAA